MYGYQAPYAHNYGRTTQNGFGGINAALSADNGEVLSLLDMCSDNYPLLSTRPQRWRCGKCPTDIIGSTVYDGADVCVYMPSGFYNYCFHIWNRDYPYNTGTSEHHVELATCGNYIIIMPHMMAFDLRCRGTIEITTDEFIQEKWATYSEGQLFEVRGGYPVSESGVIKEIEGLYQMKNGAPDYLGAVFFDMKNTVSYPFTISNGSYAGEPATGNKLTFNPSQDEAVNAFRHVFRVGDSIKISKCTHEQCNKTVVVREIGDSGDEFLDSMLEEIYCDALAGIDRIKASGAGRLTEAVRAVFAEETGIDVDALLNGTELVAQTAAKTEKSKSTKEQPRNNGPPKESYSLSHLKHRS